MLGTGAQVLIRVPLGLLLTEPSLQFPDFLLKIKLSQGWELAQWIKVLATKLVSPNLISSRTT